MKSRRIRRALRRWLSAPVALAVVIAALAACPTGASAAARAWDPAGATIAPGVTISGVPVGELDRTAASAAVTTAWAGTPVTIQLGAKRFHPRTAALGQELQLDDALDAAFAVGRTPATTPPPAKTAIKLVVIVRATKLDAWVKAANAHVSYPARNASYRLIKKRPRIYSHRVGLAVQTKAVEAALLKALTTVGAPARVIGKRAGLTRAIAPRITSRSLPPVLVVDRSERNVTVWSPRRKLHVYKIAVGQNAYPTPLGRFTVASKQKNPTWTPPPNADWAEGAEPIPPGPNNPLGTRWIGLSAANVGFHGTPNPGSVGTAASHGCMRMHRAEVERLFRIVRIGSPVHILR